MAQIHGTSGSTKYLLNGIRPINGKKLASLEEIQHFYLNYEEILAETESMIARQHEEKLLALTNEESRLAKVLEDKIAWRSIKVDTEIENLKQKIAEAAGFFTKTEYRIRYRVAISLRNHHIHSPFRNISTDLKNVQYEKAQRIKNIQNAIELERTNVCRSYQFINLNNSFLVGAQGEEVVINALSRLPDDYHVINDVNLFFTKAFHWKKMDEYIKTCQIDHIVAGPTGIFLLETKNWKISDFEVKAGKLIYQMRRSGIALWFFTKDYYQESEQPKIRKVIISLKGLYSGPKLHEYIDVVTPRHLCDYILNRKTILSKKFVKNFVDIIT